MKACVGIFLTSVIVNLVVAVLLNDMYQLDPAGPDGPVWTELSAANPPSPRMGHGFAGAAGVLYVFGGASAIGARGALSRFPFRR